MSKKNLSNKSSSGVAKELNTDALNQSLWLVKIPAFVAEQWTHRRNGELVGSLKVSVRNNGLNKSSSKHLSVTLNNDGNAPVDFVLEEVGGTSLSGDSFVAFSSNESSKSFALDGKVTKNLLLKPEGTNAYRQLIRERGQTKLTSRRETHIANVVDVQRSQNQSHTVEFITSDKNELKRKSLDSKSSRGEFSGNALLSRVFESFAVKEKQIFKEIVDFCQGAEGFNKEKDLRDVLDKYAKYTSRGAYKHLWELKPEFRDHTIAVDESDAVV